MKCVIYSCLPSGRGCAAGGGTGYKSNEICYLCIILYNEIVIFSYLPSGRGCAICYLCIILYNEIVIFSYLPSGRGCAMRGGARS